MSVSTDNPTTPEPLVVCIRRELVDAICEPAYAALPKRRADQIRARVAVLVARGHAASAEALVADEITLSSLHLEISRHIGSCWTCAVPLASTVECYERAWLETRERRLLDLVANAGGLV